MFFRPMKFSSRSKGTLDKALSLHTFLEREYCLSIANGIELVEIYYTQEI